jgi:hypothetical protein
MTRISFCPVCSQRLRIKVSNGWIAWNTSHRCQKTVEFNPEFDTELCFALCVRTGEGSSLQFTPMKKACDRSFVFPLVLRIVMTPHFPKSASLKRMRRQRTIFLP